MFGEYRLGEMIGQGQFAQVRKCTHSGLRNPRNGKDVSFAVKIMDKFKINDIISLRRLTNEISALKELNHPNLFHLIDIVHTNDYLYLVTNVV